MVTIRGDRDESSNVIVSNSPESHLEVVFVDGVARGAAAVA